MTEVEIEELQDRLRRLFPAAPFLGVVTPCRCEECRELQRMLHGRCWTDLAPEMIDFIGSLALLEPAARAAFLPAFLRRGVQKGLKVNETPLEYLVYLLGPEEETKYSAEIVAELRRRLSVEQRALVRDILQAARQLEVPLLEVPILEVYWPDVDRAIRNFSLPIWD